MTWAALRYSFLPWSSWTQQLQYRQARWPSVGNGADSSSLRFSCRCLFIRFLSTASGGIAYRIVPRVKDGKQDLSLMANEMFAGLVAIPAPFAFVISSGAFVIGAIAGVLLVGSVYFIEHKVTIDPPVGAISVHGVN